MRKFPPQFADNSQMLRSELIGALKSEFRDPLPSQLQAQCLPFRSVTKNSAQPLPILKIDRSSHPKWSEQNGGGLQGQPEPFHHTYQRSSVAENDRLPRLENDEWQIFVCEVGLPTDINSTPWETEARSINHIDCCYDDNRVFKSTVSSSESHLLKHYTPLQLDVLSTAIDDFNEGDSNIKTPTSDLAEHILQNCIIAEEQQLLAEDNALVLCRADKHNNQNEDAIDCDQNRGLLSATADKYSRASIHDRIGIDITSNTRFRHRSTWAACHPCRCAKKQCDRKDQLSGICSLCRHRQNVFGEHIYDARACCYKNITEAFLGWVDWRATTNGKMKGVGEGEDSGAN